MEPRDDHNSHIPYSETCGSARGPTSNGGKWPETRRDRHEYGKKRERSRDVDGSDKPYHGKGTRFWQGSRDRYEEPSQQTPQQPIPYFNNRDHPYIANNRHISVPQYTNINSQWSVNPMDGMAISSNMIVNQPSTALPSVSGMEMAQTTNPAMNPYAYTGMPGGGSVYETMGGYGQFSVGNSHHMVGPSLNDVITLTRCVLFRNPNTPPPTPQSKSFSCKTLHVYGLPKKVTEEILKEAFVRCGTILKIQRISNTSCYIRFESEDLMDNAFFLAGLQMTIDNKNDRDHTGRVLVEYVKDDNVECQQVLGLEDNNLQLRGPTCSPSYVVPYTEEEVKKVKENLINEETFQSALGILMSWLKTVECNKKTVPTFYSMIQIAHTHVRGLMSLKLKYEDEVNKAKSLLTKKVETTLAEFQTIDKVFSTASLQKVWDHFTKNQRKHIEDWKTLIDGAKRDHLHELLKDRIEDEMEVSEDEEETKTADASEEQKNKIRNEHNLLKEEQDTLKRQLEKLEKENMDYKSKAAVQLHKKDQHMHVLKQAAQTAEKHLMNYNSKKSKDANENQTTNDYCATINTADTSARHGTLISLISTFLTVHPFGASIDYIFSYLYQIDKTIDLRYVDNLMRCYPTVFSEVSLGVGATLEKKWKYLGFQI